jgi:phosphoribosylformylglycinamidine cyclo-ligase
MSDTPQGDYAAAGVDTGQAEAGLGRLVARIRDTWPTEGLGAVKLDVGYYANVIDVGGIGLAITTDGVGSKVLIAQMLNRYDTIGIDCIAMNVNDLICVGARPLSLVDYLAVQEANPAVMDEIAKGLCEGAKMANISIPGGEIAQLREVVQGVRDGEGFDLAGTAVGTVPLDRIVVGQDARPGDVLIGIESNGIHSNGLTLARRALFQDADLTVDSPLPSGARTVGEELLRPTHIYVREAMEMIDGGLAVKALMHITGDGFLNLARVAAPVGFEIESLPALPEIFLLIQTSADIRDDEMYRVFNMGIGLCIVVAPADADRAIGIIRSHGKQAQVIGRAVDDVDRRVTIRPARLVSEGKRFVPAP